VIKNLRINSVVKNLNKILFHKLIFSLKTDLKFSLNSLYINFVNSAQILEINKKYLRHDYSTDIITFDYGKKKLVLDAEIYISLQDAENNAKKYKVPLEQELIQLVIHGVLHLTGFDDKKAQKRVLMKKMENKLVNKHKSLLNRNRAFYVE
jgi:probable rRNA maturation factor